VKITIPSHLSAAAKSWFREIVTEYAINDRAGLLLLQQAAESWDRVVELRKIIAQDGACTKDRWGQLKAHPLLSAERDARAGFLACVKHLQLDVAAVPPEKRKRED
jgi:P27 family predicted phage terminase small subunit